jgi:hypothetical protein
VLTICQSPLYSLPNRKKSRVSTSYGQYKESNLQSAVVDTSRILRSHSRKRSSLRQEQIFPEASLVGLAGDRCGVSGALLWGVVTYVDRVAGVFLQGPGRGVMLNAMARVLRAGDLATLEGFYVRLSGPPARLTDLHRGQPGRCVRLRVSVEGETRHRQAALASGRPISRVCVD